jgi:hypothetical protein
MPTLGCIVQQLIDALEGARCLDDSLWQPLAQRQKMKALAEATKSILTISLDLGRGFVVGTERERYIITPNGSVRALRSNIGCSFVT